MIKILQVLVLLAKRVDAGRWVVGGRASPSPPTGVGVPQYVSHFGDMNGGGGCSIRAWVCLFCVAPTSEPVEGTARAILSPSSQRGCGISCGPLGPDWGYSRILRLRKSTLMLPSMKAGGDQE
ncbi:hypothetical protein NDU88_002392 [Pleurodeles waltl]|uniref:Secreted protein n=1 Tax=Pleurodeles waltl TaxID=8319 RepID=A0AAV7UX52_PLEWA|nr:hypothetical protein NDU88_002392 [Pleurodeles waltl]